MEQILPVLLWVVIIGAAVFHFVIKKNNNRKAAQTGEDKQRVKQAVEQVMGGAGDYQLAYAHWEKQESYGRAVRTTYFRYAAAFRDQTLWVIPLGIDKKTRQIQAGNPVTLSADRLGKVTVKTKEKDGAANQVEVWLGDKQGHAVMELKVSAENLRKNRWFPVNILQQEECEAFLRFITALTRQVTAENPGVDAIMEAEAAQSLGVLGAVVSGIGAFCGLFYPPIGVPICAAGLIMGIVGMIKGGKGIVGLIISAACLIFVVAYGWSYFMYLLS